MFNSHPKFTCFPSVVCVGKEIEVSIFPRDNSRRFRQDKEYELSVLAMRSDDMLDYHSPLPYPHPCEVKNGCLCFTHTFKQEEEYVIRFREKGQADTKIYMYAVEEDLYQLRPLKGDLHTHSYYSDGQDGVAMVPANYREEGFDFFALTDHNRMYTSKLINELYQDIPLGMHMMIGEEVHTPGSNLHIVHVGGKESVCNQYIKHTDDYEKEVDEIAETLSHIPEQYRRRTAMAKWACDKIHKAEGLAIFAHPFWAPRCYNTTKDFTNILFDEVDFDAFELLGGISSKGNNLQIALWQEQAFKGNIIPVVGSSDSHNHNFADNSFGRRFTIVFAKSNTTEDILDAITKGYSVAGEISPDSDDDVRFYGSQLRLILFAHFLFTNYFNETMRLCFGEGVLMRRYAEGEPVGELLASFADSIENFYQKFYGKVPTPILTEKNSAFLDKCLEMQRTVGPETKGSSIYLYGTNPNRE